MSNTSIDMTKAKDIVSGMINEKIEILSMDHIVKFWEKTETNPRFETYEAMPRNKVVCNIHYVTHKLYSDIFIKSQKWDGYFMASLDAILMLKHEFNIESYK